MDDDRLVAWLTAAREAVDRANLPSDLRSVAFARALDYLGGGAKQTVSQSYTSAPTPTGDRLAQLAGRLGVERGAAEYVYDAQDGGLTLVLARSKLPAEKRRATRAVAILYAAAKQAAYGDEWTYVSEIREQCRLFGVLDPPNFSAAVATAADALIGRGRGADRSVKVTKAGYEEAARLIGQLTS